MSLRWRLVLSLAALAAAATTVASGTAYFYTKSGLYREVDRSIDEVQALIVRPADRLGGRPTNATGGPTSSGPGGGTNNTNTQTPSFRDIESRARQLVYATQFLDSSGQVVSFAGTGTDQTLTIPVDDADRKLAISGGSSLRRTRISRTK